MNRAYNNLDKGPKRLIWVGYLAYLIWMNLLGGWDAIIDRYLYPITDNNGVDFVFMLALYWVIMFLVLWVWDGF